MTITKDAVLRECRYWSTGRRGEPVEPAELADADLGAFVEQALTIGASALSGAGGTQQAYAVENLIADAEQRSTQASELAALQTTDAVKTASETLTKSAADTAKLVSASLEKANWTSPARSTACSGARTRSWHGA